MKKIIIEGGNKLSGSIKISGMKNSVVALIPAAILSDEEVSIYNVPNISDTQSILSIMKLLKCGVNHYEDIVTINTREMENILIPEELSKKLRASYYFMGALLGKYKKCEMYFPGGCNIGKRPIDFHLHGFELLGAKVKIEGDKYTIWAEELRGCSIYLDFASVGATINLMFAAVKAKGTTIINNAAKEPDIVNVATFLNNMGAKISGAGTSIIKIEGVEKLGKAIIEVIPDRIEAGTYLIIGALVGENLKITGIIKEHLEALISKLKETGVNLVVKDNEITISAVDNMEAINVKTLVFPGFPTDLGQPMVVLLTQCEGTSIFEETIWENRKGHISYLIKMGADISVNDQTCIIKGASVLKGVEVTATDLRAGAALIAAGLIAQGTTTINEVEHILRGYENIVDKLKGAGAKIKVE